MHAELIARAFEDQPTVTLKVVRRLEEARASLDDGDAPDMIIADLRLPDGRGIELCEGRDLPVVIMTSQGSETDAVEAMRAGALDYIVKSDLMFSEMPHVVERALREWGLAKAHDRADRQLRTQFEIASALATSATLEQAGPRILESVCRGVGWPVGELWLVDEGAQVLRREACCVLEPSLDELIRDEHSAALSKGEGFPGQLWAAGKPTSECPPFPVAREHWRAAIVRLGLRCAYGLPVLASSGRPLAVLTFFAWNLEHVNGDIERLVRTISAQLDVFAERQRAEQTRRSLQRELYERERLAAVGETAATLAHEIGNPLNSMYMHAQLLKRRVSRAAESLDPKIVEGVDMLLAENKRLAGLLDDFRSLSRGSSLRSGPVHPREMLERLLVLQQPLLESASVQLHRELADELPSFEGDEDKLKQVLLNLFKNAIEAMPEGGHLTVRAAVVDGAHIVIEVQDTGVGVPEGLDVFEPFRTTKPTGTGLGLSIARRVVVAHGGSLSCSSEPGIGTTFRVELPVLPESR